MNLNLVIDTSRFKPFEYYNAALQTMKDYGTLYEKQQAVYDKIALTLGDLASAVEGSTKAKQIYDVYLNLFNATASDFANGMNIRNAKELSDLRRLYGTLIRQLERANEARVKEAERRRAAKPEQNMLYELMGTLDDYLTDPNRIYGSYSGTLLTNEVSALAAAAGKDIINRYNEGSLDPYTKIWVEKKGLSSENVNKAVQEVQLGGIDNVSDPIMKNILRNAMQASGIYNWADESTKRTAEQLAARGLYGGIGQAASGAYEDYGRRQALLHYYSIELAKELSRIKLEEALNALKNYGFGNTGGIGETIPLHFSDSNVAGNVMKSRMAEATVEFMKKHANNPNVKKIKAYWDAHGGWDKAKEYWATNGFNGAKKWTGDGNDNIYYSLGNYLRENVTKNEALINIWRSPFTATASPATSSSSLMPGQRSSNYTSYKDWGDFNTNATQGYTYNGIIAADDPTQLSEYLTKMLPYLTSNGQVKLYDILDIDASGNIKYSKTPTELGDMPIKTVNGRAEIDTSGITSRVTLPDGSWLLTWNDKDGNPVLKVLRKSDRSLEYLGDLDNLDAYGKKLKTEDYKDHPEMWPLIDLMIITAKQNRGYDVQRLVNVEKLKK